MKSKKGRILIAVLCVIVLVVCIFYFVKKDKSAVNEQAQPQAQIVAVV